MESVARKGFDLVISVHGAWCIGIAMPRSSQELLLTAGSDDGTARIWRPSGECLQVRQAVRSGVQWWAFAALSGECLQVRQCT